MVNPEAREDWMIIGYIQRYTYIYTRTIGGFLFCFFISLPFILLSSLKKEKDSNNRKLQSGGLTGGYLFNPPDPPDRKALSGCSDDGRIHCGGGARFDNS